MTATRKTAILNRETICFSGNFFTGAKPGTIAAGERVRIMERIEESLVDGKPHVRIKARDGRWAWVRPEDVS